MKHSLTLLCCLLLSSCSISHKTVYLQAWGDKPHLYGWHKNYLVRIALPRDYKLKSIISGGEFDVEYCFFDHSDSSVVFVSNVEPGLESLSQQYNILSRHDSHILDYYSSEYRYRHIRYGYRNISYEKKYIMDALMKEVIIDSVKTKVNKGAIFPRKLEHNAYKKMGKGL